jgi:transposase-like protein
VELLCPRADLVIASVLVPGSTTPKLITAQTVKAVKTGAMSQAHGMKYRGRKPTFSREQFTLVRELLDQGIAVSAIAKTTALKRQSIYRIQAEPERQLAALLAWYPSEVVKQTARTFQSLTRRLRQASKRRPGLPRPTRRSGKRRASLIAPSLARA